VTSPPPEELTLSDLDRVVHIVAMALTEAGQVKSAAELSGLVGQHPFEV
jgi:hypothetical protein